MPARRVNECTRKTAENKIRRKRSCIIFSLISIALIIYVFIRQNVFSARDALEIIRIACDACFVCGLLFSCMFVLSLCYYHGAFDFIMYGVGVIMDTLFRKKEEETARMFTDFATYLRQNSETKRLNKTSLVFAVAFLLLGVFFLVLYFAAG